MIHSPTRLFAACVLLVLPSSEGFLTASPVHQSILSAGERTFSSTVEDTDTAEVVEAETEPVAPINGWVPDESKPCFGLPGAVAPTGFFDPLGFCQVGIPLNDVKRYREAEVQHGRVAMVAAVGYLVGENFGGPFGLQGPANDQLAQLPGPALALLTLVIGICETRRATVGWVEPGTGSLWTLRDSYYPGDIGFDPLELKPTSSKEFNAMQTKELQNGRLAMIGVAGMCAQELCNHKTILETYEFYNKISQGIDPYDTAITVGGAAVVPL